MQLPPKTQTTRKGAKKNANSLSATIKIPKVNNEKYNRKIKG